MDRLDEYTLEWVADKITLMVDNLFENPPDVKDEHLDKWLATEWAKKEVLRELQGDLYEQIDKLETAM